MGKKNSGTTEEAATPPDFSAKLLHLAWHPGGHNLIAAAASAIPLANLFCPLLCTYLEFKSYDGYTSSYTCCQKSCNDYLAA